LLLVVIVQRWLLSDIVRSSAIDDIARKAANSGRRGPVLANGSSDHALSHEQARTSNDGLLATYSAVLAMMLASTGSAGGAIGSIAGTGATIYIESKEQLHLPLIGISDVGWWFRERT